MNISFVGEPPERQIIRWEYQGIDDSLYAIYLECGHYWSGLTREMPHGDTFPCGQCTIVRLDDMPDTPAEYETEDGDVLTQLSLFGEAE